MGENGVWFTLPELDIQPLPSCKSLQRLEAESDKALPSEIKTEVYYDNYVIHFSSSSFFSLPAHHLIMNTEQYLHVLIT